jgi:hypothetical protein
MNSARPLFEAKPVLEQRCIFCRTSNRAASLEHVVPAGLGRHSDLILPLGAVCEPCNNHLGRQIDEALVHLFEVQMIRGYHRVPDRRGRLVKEIPLRNGAMSFPDDKALEVTVHGDNDLTEGEDTVRVSAVAKRRRSGDQWRRAARAVLKMGLCLVCYGYGHEVALEPEWNSLRAAIAGEPYESYLLIGEFDIFATPHLKASLLTDVPGMSLAAQLRFGGLDLIADLHLTPANEEMRSWAERDKYRVMDIAPRT